MAEVARADDRFVREVTDRVASELHRRAAALRAQGAEVTALGSAEEVAERMLGAVPQPSPWSELGPFYSTRGIARVLGGVSRQAADERRRRRSLLALRTSDGVWVYPAFQLDDDNRVVAGLSAVLACFAGSAVDDWSLASMLAGPQEALGGRSVVGWLKEGRPLDDVLALCRASAARLAS